jgi:hypothetical protein
MRIWNYRIEAVQGIHDARPSLDQAILDVLQLRTQFLPSGCPIEDSFHQERCGRVWSFGYVVFLSRQVQWLLLQA